MKEIKNQKLKMKSFNAVLICILFFSFPRTVFAADVVINEFVPDASPEWVEFKNASSSAEFIKSYWLDDDTDFASDSGSSNKKPLSDLNISSVVYPWIEITSFLNNSGDYVVLFNELGNVVGEYQYTSNPGDGVSIGRDPDGTGSFAILQSATKGSANSVGQTPSPTPSPTQSPTAIPTSTPTALPSPTKTPSPTLKPTPSKIPEPTPKEDSKAQSSELVLGVQNSPTPSPMPTEEPFLFIQGWLTPGKILPFVFKSLPFVFILGGIALVGGAAVSFVHKRRIGYNTKSESHDLELPRDPETG